MSRVVALGERRHLEGFELAGVGVIRAEDRDEARAAWSDLAANVAVVIFTPTAERAVSDLLGLHPEVIWTTLPG